MASGWNSGSDREAMLRRVAIVLSSLPASTAAKLLGSIDAETKDSVKRTMSTLSDVDPLERQRAIQAFKVTCRRQPTPPLSSDGDSLQIQSAGENESTSATSRVVTPDATLKTTQPKIQSPLSFLGDVDDATLARLLGDEHPQAIAFVLVSVSPDQAARVLPRLEAELQKETMGRIGRLGEIPEAAVAEVAEHFRLRLQDNSVADQHALGRRALEAIMEAMPKSEPFDAGQADHPSTRFSTAVHAGHQADASATPIAASSDVHATSTDLSAKDLSNRLRIAEETWPDQYDSGSTTASDLPAEHVSTNASTAKKPTPLRDPHEREPSQVSELQSHAFRSTDEIHQHLVQMSPSELCDALGKVDTRDAMLALCGLPVEIANAALAILPRAQSRQVRNKMNSLGSIQLREIDRAKESVATASLTALPSPALRTPLAA